MKRKVLAAILAILFVTSFQAHATTFTEDGEINGGTYSEVYILNDATVDMIAGMVDSMYVEDSGTLNYFDGSIEQIILDDSSTMNIESSSLIGTSLSLSGSSYFNLNGGSYQGTLDAGEYSHNIMNDGQLTATLANFYGYVITDVYGGNITWDFISLHGYAALNIYGGDVSFNNGFNLNEDAEINVYYSSIISQERPYEILGYQLLDGSEFMLDQFTQYEIDQINFIPEPSTLLLLSLGGILLRKKR